MNTALKAVLRMDHRSASGTGNPVAMWKFECPPRALRNENTTKIENPAIMAGNGADARVPPVGR
jgi:hypothetical protein